MGGNLPVVKYFLARRAKFSDCCHPSKKALDGRTPLQLAITSGSVPLVEFLLKDATVHDVERCWMIVTTSPDIRDDIRNTLEMKVCFPLATIEVSL